MRAPQGCLRSQIPNLKFKSEIQFRPDHTVHQCFRTHILAAVRLFNCQRAISANHCDNLRYRNIRAHEKLVKLQRGGECYRLLSRCQIRGRENSRPFTGPINRPINRCLLQPDGHAMVAKRHFLNAARTVNVLHNLRLASFVLQFIHHNRRLPGKGDRQPIIRRSAPGVKHIREFSVQSIGPCRD